VCYVDSTVALPLLSAYAVANHAKRSHRRLYEQREELLATLTRDYQRQLNKQKNKR
jgi:deoxyhypusine synthase